MAAYYNEIEPYAAQWLRNLIAAGHIAPGEVDTRSIEDVHPDDLRPFTQCHFFAGIGIWSLALRRAGWADDRPIWTGSCPCQPFSAAGKGVGFDDERHLWPAFHYLASICRPSVICGEQVASKDGRAWLDLVQTDLEAADYATWAAVVPVAGVGGPHERHRLWWVGIDNDLENPARHGLQRLGGYRNDDSSAWRLVLAGASQPNGLADAAHRDGRGGERGAQEGAWANEQRGERLAGGGDHGGMADAAHERRGESGTHGEWCACGDCAQRWAAGLVPGGAPSGVDYADDARPQGHAGHGGAARPQPRPASEASVPHGVADAASERREMAIQHERRGDTPGGVGQASERGNGGASSVVVDGVRPGPVNGFWRDADWLFCTDGKWRPVEPGTRPLAHGLPRGVGTFGARLERLCDIAGVDRASALGGARKYRVGALKAYGNAICPEPAQAFIEAWMDAAP